MAVTTRSDLRVPDGPDGLPLLGSTLSLARDVFGFYERLHEEYGDVARYEVAGDEGYLVAHPDLVEQVLVTDDSLFVKGDLLSRSLSTALGDGMLLAEGADWRAQRTLAQPAFYRERVETYAGTMVEYARDVTERWDDGDVIDIHAAMRELTLRVLARTLFGVDIRGRESVVRESARAIRARTDATSLAAYAPDWMPTPRNRRYKRAVVDIREFVERLVADRRSGDGGDDLLSLLVRAADEGGMRDEQLRDNMVTFLFAGHDTSALALTYTWFLLGHHPEKQDRLHAELDDALDGDAPTAADLPTLSYTGWAADEAMRRYPPVYTHFREPVEDVAVGDYLIPEGAIVSLPQWVVHHDERWFDAPLDFRPERWATWDGPEYAYFPFSGGPRHCIGMRFARTEIRLLLATIARRFRVESVTEAPLDLVATANAVPDGPVRVRLHER